MSRPPSRPPSIGPNATRREFLRQGGAALVAGATLPYASATTYHPHGSDVLRVGLVGCGGRGRGAAAEALKADPNARLVALGDAFADPLADALSTLASTREVAAQVDVPPERRFVGFDAYQGVIEASDVVLLATSPHFRPLHVAAAVEAKKHLFVEKPVAVDAPGVRWMMESSERARARGLSLVSGLCYRYEDAKRETIARVHDGAIGDVVALQCTYNTGGLWHRGRKPEWSEMEYQMRNWLYFTWLSGDHIAEQHIHSLDKLAWAMRDEYPVKCTASGGRTARTGAEYGNVYDHFNTVFEWERGVRGFSSCRQWVGADTDVSDHVFGTKGVAQLQRHEISGENPWRKRRGEEPDDMYQNEHDALFASIRPGEPIANGEYMCKSTMMAIMARMSAYTGQSITWEEAWSSKLDLTPAAYEWTDVEPAEVARPGVTKFV